jgi:hypothetical protein
MQVELLRALSDITDGHKFLFLDHPEHTANGKSASLMCSVSFLFLMCLQRTMNCGDNSKLLLSAMNQLAF